MRVFVFTSLSSTYPLFGFLGIIRPITEKKIYKEHQNVVIAWQMGRKSKQGVKTGVN